ncbi:hypothetical protein CCMA1212_006067 [Trichoderma ghanense]|uniref:SSCRP protein n=1 Tax=Trichoderma ghanense TaxID=65468 RepID=A0ABY2H2Z3_9HYPO
MTPPRRRHRVPSETVSGLQGVPARPSLGPHPDPKRLQSGISSRKQSWWLVFFICALDLSIASGVEETRSFHNQGRQDDIVRRCAICMESAVRSERSATSCLFASALCNEDAGKRRFRQKDASLVGSLSSSGVRYAQAEGSENEAILPSQWQTLKQPLSWNQERC